MVRTSVLHDALNSINNAEKAGKRQVMIRPSSKVIVKFLQVMQRHGYIGEFEEVDDHRSGKIVVQLNGRLNKCGVISPRFNVRLAELEKWVVKLLPALQKFAATKPNAAPAGSHPIWHLMTEAEHEFDAVKSRQSSSLSAAVAEYRRRYGLPPPPHFDKWWAFAKARNVKLIDEFDTIHDQLAPFWAVKPATIRARAREALGFSNQLMGVQIRGGNASHIFGGFEWVAPSVLAMMKDFLQYLPDMDLAFNANDEPRVVVPHDDMTRLMHTARTVAMPAANAAGKKLRNEFSPRPADLNYAGRFNEVVETRFDFFAHQPVWTHSRMSCPPDSPARVLDEADRFDDVAKYALGELGFVRNWTAMSDICLSPSLESTYGFFERPNAYGVVHDLFPIFSQSKISSYADILYPSPWYWANKVPYDPANDHPWAQKLDRLYWRGSTTGGFSRNGGWRRQHRQRLVQKLNAPGQAKILRPTSPPPSNSSPPDASSTNNKQEHQPQVEANQSWTVREVPRGDFRPLLDVHFSHIGQCDEGDCDAQRAFFALKEYAPQEEALRYKHVLDMDGNAFSGRFYALLKSHSLVYKWGIFREWHHEWLRPWVHFVPLSLRGEEWVEVVRFFVGNGEGKKDGERVARGSREWAGEVLRNEDLEVWFFRLLLEYGRLIDDDRENIGYSG
ncbi:hypothetical protein C8A05DRAFT_43960 [Staphylotrichum tortipilum]|uniref:Glycosyl transferase CAP10 domain-containing protein n=1 Tax=Staphylotrichum tortipilum TaxID=2831512 RepID=A0AAN6RUK6_9PEZI|nr:hypothetical protein C8A05DRAFT_43960 [Staphylotrichum longicolle]